MSAHPVRPIEKRQDVRYPAHRSSILKHNNERFYTTIINFSASGVGFLSAHSLSVNEQTELVFEVEFDKETVHYTIPIKVVRCTEDSFEFNIGAQLDTVTFEYRQLLKKLAKMHLELTSNRSL